MGYVERAEVARILSEADILHRKPLSAFNWQPSKQFVANEQGVHCVRVRGLGFKEGFCLKGYFQILH